MANLTIKTTANSFIVDTGAYYPLAAKSIKSSFNKLTVTFHLDATFVKVYVGALHSWALTFDGSAGSLQVDSVNGGAAPESNLDLFNQLVAAI